MMLALLQLVSISISGAFSAPVSPALPSEGFAHVPCKEQIASLLTGWESQAKWRRQAASGEHSFFFATPTKTLGIWTELHSAGDGSVRAVRMAGDSMTEVSWNRETCEPSMRLQKFKPKKAAERRSWFLDEDLRKLVESGKSGVVYVWSPGMVYSMDAFAELEKAAKKLKLEVTAVMDPFIGAERARALTKKSPMKLSGHDRRLSSVELMARGAMTHYPAAFVYSKGKLAETEIVGAYDAAEFEKHLKTDLGRIGAE